MRVCLMNPIFLEEIAVRFENFVIGGNPGTPKMSLSAQARLSLVTKSAYVLNQQIRERIGDWEADSVIGCAGKACLLTLVDRKSRFLLGQRILSTRRRHSGTGSSKILYPIAPSSMAAGNQRKHQGFTSGIFPQRIRHLNRAD